MGDGDSNDFEGLSDEEIAAIKDGEDDDDGGTPDDIGDDAGSGDGGDDDRAGAGDAGDKGAGAGDDDGDGNDAGAGDGAGGDTGAGDDKGGIEDKKDASDTGDAGDVKEYDDKIKALDAKLDEGDINFDDYKKSLLAIERDRTRAIVREETTRISAEKTWESEQATFFGDEDNIKLKENFIVYDAFAREVNRLLGVKEWRSKSGPEILVKAKEAITTAFGIQPKVVEKEESEANKAIKAAKAAGGKRTDIQTLKNVPASDQNSDIGKFAYLDKLKGVAYENALGSLSKADQDAYENT